MANVSIDDIVQTCRFLSYGDSHRFHLGRVLSQRDQIALGLKLSRARQDDDFEVDVHEEVLTVRIIESRKPVHINGLAPTRLTDDSLLNRNFKYRR